jgi:hypothetical protein
LLNRAWPLLKTRKSLACGLLWFIAAVLALLPCHYAISDDLAILLDVQDGYDATFFGILAGRALSFLYAHVSRAVSWYGLALYGAHAIGVFVLLDAAVSTKRVKHLWLALLFFAVPAYAGLLLRVNYSTAAMMTGIEGVLAFQFLLRRPCPSPISAALSGTVFAISFLIRWHAWLVVCSIALPLLVVEVACQRRRAKLVAVFLAPALLAAALSAGASRYSVSPEYRHFAQLAEVMHRPGVFRPVLSANPAVLQANRWSQQDYFFLHAYFFPDERKFNATTLGRQADAAAAELRSTWGARLRRTPSEVLASGARFRIVLLGLLVASLLVLPWRRTCALLAYLLYGLTAMGAMVGFFYLPEHVGIPLWLFLIGVLTWFLLAERRGWRPRWNGLAVGIAALALAWSGLGEFYTLAAAVRRDRIKQAVVQSTVDQISAERPGSAVLWVCCALELEYVTSLRPWNPDFSLLVGGWATFTPRSYDLRRKHFGVGAAQAMLPAMVDNKNAFLLATSDAATAIGAFARRSYGLSVAFTKVNDLGVVGLFGLRNLTRP